MKHDISTVIVDGSKAILATFHYINLHYYTILIYGPNITKKIDSLSKYIDEIFLLIYVSLVPLKHE